MNSGWLSAALEGFLLGGGLIIAIGAQNMFVLRQGLLRQHTGIVALVCSLSDALLIGVGVAGAGIAISGRPALITAATAGGAVFVAAYGVLAARRAWRGASAGLEEAPRQSGLAAVVATCLALTFLNPHVYLDTVVLVGAVSARYEGAIAVAFGLGAATASFAWFFGLAYGAKALAPLFQRPGAWRWLDAAVAITMLAIAARLAAELFF